MLIKFHLYSFTFVGKRRKFFMKGTAKEQSDHLCLIFFYCIVVVFFKNISLSLLIHLLIDIWILPVFDHCKKCCSAHPAGKELMQQI